MGVYRIAGGVKLNAKRRILCQQIQLQRCIALRRQENTNSSVKKRSLSLMANEYVDAITALNNLQTNAAVIAQSVKERSRNAYKNPAICLRNLNVIGIGADDLNKLNVVHVSGTKGKGSTCALVESMLRCYGYKTGLYTSPHLIEVRERIRINGLPLSKEKFSTYFWVVYNTLKNHEITRNEMPAYFAFLTVLAFKTFIEENVDVAILEVGVGGEFDQTNVVPKPVVVGVTSLGFDHTNILGNTIESIARNKAGIFRESVFAFTVEQNYSEGLMTLLNKAVDIKCPLYLCPPLSTYLTADGASIQIGIEGDAQAMNTSLALQLCNRWLTVTNNKDIPQSSVSGANILMTAEPFAITNEQLQGIRNCKWPGRCHILVRNRITYFMDGAHTLESIQYCISWFTRQSEKLCKNKKVIKALLFNSTGERNVESLLKQFDSINFDIVLFTPNNPSLEPLNHSDLIDYNSDFRNSLKSVKSNLELWQKMPKKTVPANYFKCIKDALRWIDQYSEQEVHLLVTGSLRLVGGLLSIIDPQLQESMS